ncbi:polysaccharide deacetylase family protein [Bacillus sp. B190/17]|uniref:Polysaccharide deacetylase family protein n=1 Tax=Bacillus lumedeiriae TaxID=3058829 RepID=A0ABW8IBM3_9BACI
MLHNHGTFIISLDFELYWGVHDVMSIEEYKENLLGARRAVPKLLEMFEEYHIHATWAAVGLLFFRTKQEMMQSLPKLRPRYQNRAFSAYEKMGLLGDQEENDPYHFASSLIKKISNYKYQEIATHTFSHYYCLEEGQTEEEFEADLIAALNIGKEQGFSIKTIIFPRNQVNEKYLSICKKHGIISYRGNEKHMIYEPASFAAGNLPLKRIIRMADTYLNITGRHIYSAERAASTPLINLSSSRFLRPYHPNLKILDSLRLKRIKNSLTAAAKERKIYHLWWHPHNFGKNLEENMAFLKEIIEHYIMLKKTYGMEALNMAEAAEKLNSIKNK